MAYKGLPATERNVRAFDALSAVLCAGLFASLSFGIAGMAHLGWPAVLAAFSTSTACGFLLWRREQGHAAPILAADLFQIRMFTLSAATAMCAFAVQGLVFVVLPFLFQFSLGYSQVEAGFLITPWPATLVFMTLVAPYLVSRVAPGVLGCLGLLIVAVGLGLLTTLSQTAGIYDIMWRLIVCGIGFGLFQSPNMVAIMNSAPRHRSGGAGGILATSRLLGQAVGAAAVAFWLSVSPNHGIEAAIWFGVGMAVLGSVVSALRVTSFARN